MSDPCDNAEHSKNREEFIAVIRAEVERSGINRAGLAKLTAFLGQLYDMSCEHDFEVQVCASGIKPKGSTGPLVLDQAFVMIQFGDAEEIREAAAREEMRRERSN